jgi:class 3 adenylate cyclase
VNYRRILGSSDSRIARKPGDFDQVLREVTSLLLQHDRVSYRGLKRRFAVDDEYIEDIKAELIDGRAIAIDQGGTTLVRVSATATRAPSVEHEAAGRTAERRQLTIMFCDLVNSTELSARLDPEDYRELILRYHEQCGQAVSRYGGHVAQYLGDGIQIYFGYPRAHDASVSSAIRAALQIVRELPGSAQCDAAALSVRIGIHTGLVVVGAVGQLPNHSELLALGETPNLAARVQALAAPNSVVITDSSRALLRESFELVALGEHSLRGISRSIELYRVIGLPSFARASAPADACGIVGRTADLTLLRARFDSALGGVGQVVAISGEPGIGKSCLIRAFRARLGNTAQQWECRCAPYHAGEVLQPIVELLRRTFQIDDHDMHAIARDKLRGGLLARQQSEETFDHFSALLSLGGKAAQVVTRSPLVHRRRTMELLTSFLLARAAHEPVVFVIEDVQWSDPSTLEFLATLSVQARATRSLLLLSHRPDFHTGWRPDQYTTTVTLDRLAARDALTFVQSLLGDRRLPAVVIDELLDKADGMPLFIEELTRVLLDATDSASAVGIPSSITDSLLMRLDQLGPAREIAQIGAVLGRCFHYELLAALWRRDEASLREHLCSVVRSGLLLQRGFPPDALYTFKHALVQEAASDTLLRRHRRRLHERAARALLTLLPQLSAAQPERVARHFTEAQRHEEALQHWELAADKALETAASLEAARHLRKALEVLNELPPSRSRDQREVALLVKLHAPLTVSQGYASQELAQTCQRAHRLCSHAGTPFEQWSVLHGLYSHYLVSGDLQTANGLEVELGHLAGQCARGAVELQMCLVRGHAFWRGKFNQARPHFEQIRCQYELERDADQARDFSQDPLVLALSYLHAIDTIVGNPLPDPSFAALAIAHAKRIGHAYSLAFAYAFAGAVAQLAGDAAMVGFYAAEVIALSKEHGFSMWLADGEILLGWADAQAADVARALELLSRGLASWEATGARLWHSRRLAMQAELQLALHHTREAGDAIERAQLLVDQNGERLMSAELMRLRGELELSKRPHDLTAARVCMQRAIEIARADGAHILEVKAQRSLVRLNALAQSPQLVACNAERRR